MEKTTLSNTSDFISEKYRHSLCAHTHELSILFLPQLERNDLQLFQQLLRIRLPELNWSLHLNNVLDIEITYINYLLKRYDQNLTANTCVAPTKTRRLACFNWKKYTSWKLEKHEIMLRAKSIPGQRAQTRPTYCLSNILP